MTPLSTACLFDSSSAPSITHTPFSLPPPRARRGPRVLPRLEHAAPGADRATHSARGQSVGAREARDVDRGTVYAVSLPWRGRAECDLLGVVLHFCCDMLDRIVGVVSILNECVDSSQCPNRSVLIFLIILFQCSLSSSEPSVLCPLPAPPRSTRSSRRGSCPCSTLCRRRHPCGNCASSSTRWTASCRPMAAWTARVRIRLR